MRDRPDSVHSGRPARHIGPDTDDLQLNELIGELSVRSDRFRSLWARHDARPKLPGPTLMDHPQLGRLELHYHRFPIPASEGQEIVIYHAEPGSRTAQSLALLAPLNAGQPTRAERPGDFAAAPGQPAGEARDHYR